jgi:hypothetical protein
MTCDNCGQPCKGRVCKQCEMIEFNEGHHGVPSDESPNWLQEPDGEEDDDE